MTALVDTNLLVALAVESHRFNPDASRLFASSAEFMIAAHSLAELYNTLTRPAMYAWPPMQAARFVEQLATRVSVRSLSTDQYLDAVQRFALSAGIGPRIYDFLIGEVAVLHQLNVIVSMNVRDFAPLFPTLAIRTPAQYLETL